MCGIFALLNRKQTLSLNTAERGFEKGRNRGPEYSVLKEMGGHVLFGFHRLAINGMDTISNQPISVQNVHLICNGEIYNFKHLYEQLGITPSTHSDCEVIIHLYIRYGMAQTLAMLDGVFAFVLFDERHHKVYVARDPFGVRPLYAMVPSHICAQNQFAFSSELKMLTDLKQALDEPNFPTCNIMPFLPGRFQEMVFDKYQWTLLTPLSIYHRLPFSCVRTTTEQSLADIYKGVQYYFKEAIKKRYFNTDRPVACLLSGGLDSSSIVACINELHKQTTAQPLETYSIGLLGSEDLRNARIVADYLGTKHTEVILQEGDFFRAIEDTIYNIETFDTTTVRASIPNSELCKHISKVSGAKVIFNGDGADELFGGYIYEYKAPDAYAFDADIRRLLDNIYKHDVRRSDGSISSHGLEPRTPFLDRALVQYVMSISPEIRFHVQNGKCEKYLFRNAFSREHCVNAEGNQLLPDCILWRTKEAFSDGVSSSKERSLFTVLQEQITEHLNKTSTKEERLQKMATYTHLAPKTDEQYYYRTLFDKLFPGCDQVVTDFWMPRFVQTDDPSARTLALYNVVGASQEETTKK